MSEGYFYFVICIVLVLIEIKDDQTYCNILQYCSFGWKEIFFTSLYFMISVSNLEGR